MKAIFPTSSQGRRPTRGAFTLVEIMIVVIILGVLAAIVIPQFSNASQVARENTLKDELRYLRTQLEVYKAQHLDRAPGYQGGVLSGDIAGTFVQQMTSYTDAQGDCSDAATATCVFGPYLNKMPSNPLTSANTIKVVTDSSQMVPDDSTGWIYNAAAGDIHCNSTATDEDGNPVFGY